MTVKINGTLHPVSTPCTLAAVLSETGYDIRRIAVECNGEIIPKSQYEKFLLQDGDTLEVVTFVGGG